MEPKSAAIPLIAKYKQIGMRDLGTCPIFLFQGAAELLIWSMGLNMIPRLLHKPKKNEFEKIEILRVLGSQGSGCSF